MTTTLARSRARLATAIAAEIKRQRLTQTEAARRTGVSQSRISRVIAGDLEKTSTGRLLEILEALDTVVRITIRQRRDDERARITVIDKLREPTPAPMVAMQSPPQDISDLAALANLLAERERKLAQVEGELQFERQRIDELGGPTFDEPMDAAILLSRARSSGDLDAEATARERVEAAVEALLDQRKDIREADLN